MDIMPLKPGVNAANLPIEQLAANPNISQKDKVTEACRQFEAVLLRQILGDARKTVISSGQQESTVTGIYNDMVTKQLADSISHSGAFGLAKSLESQLVRQVLPQASSTDVAPASGAVKAINPPHS